ncbi:Synaptic vesicle membrane VAT-1-like protein [Brachionus plicatilis]|uniref:Synaptic vesicle membrane VAT-1-like protein n=1 Tax=Brachionus plicatilis TaxID=10195 RepID=A0A3M7SQ24_BRAPC|nr:Synaptic vesicle membrane VAT-1-like protein [Brachionus plicatilis]
MSEKIKAIVLTSASGSSDFSNLQIKEENYPKIEKDDQVIVRIKAAGLNFAELMQRQGFYKPAQKTPYTPGFEASGVVEEIGTAVTDLQVDDRVIVFNGSGMWKEVVCLSRSNLIKLPESMSFENGAALMVNYLTAYQILFRMVSIKPGDVVLIHMAAGGVGFAATQLCKTIKDVTVIGTASAAKHDAIKQNGVAHCIDYTQEDYVQEVKKLFPLGIDVVLDPLNGENAIKGYDLLRPFGRICHYGAASITSESRSFMNAFKAWWKCLSVTSLDIINHNKSVSGYHLGFLMNNPSCVEQTHKDILHLLEMYQKGQIKMQIDSTYVFSKIGEAMKRMHSRLNVGKIILKPDSEVEKEEGPANVEQVTVATEQKVEQCPVEQVQHEQKSPEEVARSENTEANKELTQSEFIEHETSKLAPIADEPKHADENGQQSEHLVEEQTPSNDQAEQHQSEESQINENKDQ